MTLCFIQFCLSQAHIYDNHKTSLLREFECVFSYILTFKKSLKIQNSVCCYMNVLYAHYILQTQPWVFESSIWEMCGYMSYDHWHLYANTAACTERLWESLSELVRGLTNETIWTDSLMCIKMHQLHVLLVGNQCSVYVIRLRLAFTFSHVH